MTLWRNQTHEDIWIQHHCERCWHGLDCPILGRALKSRRKPPQWDRNPRKGALMADTIKCNSETRKPPNTKQPKMFEDIPMFDVTAPVRMDPEHD